MDTYLQKTLMYRHAQEIENIIIMFRRSSRTLLACQYTLKTLTCFMIVILPSKHRVCSVEAIIKLFNESNLRKCIYTNAFPFTRLFILL
jgi:hypothetical protein